MSDVLIQPDGEAQPIDSLESLTVRRCSDEELTRWNRFVAETPGGTIYHSTIWSDVVADCYGYRPIMLALESPDQELRGVLPLHLVDSRLTGRRLVSLPCSNIAGPLCLPGVDPAPLVRAAVHLARELKCQYLEIRGQPCHEPTSIAGLHTVNYYGTFLLGLQTDGMCPRDRFDRRAKRGIARARKSDVRVRFADEASAVRQFYDLHVRTRRKHGVPPQPLAFFELLWARLRQSDSIEILVAHHAEQVIAAIVLLMFGDTVTYAYGASAQPFLRLAPNHALFDAAIAWAVERGYRYFDFGRTPPDNPGLMEFKRQWGAMFLPLPYHYWPEPAGFVAQPESSLMHRCFASIWRHLPVRVTTLVGPRLYRHLT